MSKKPLACYHCRRPFSRASGAGLFCGDDCQSEHNSKSETSRDQLISAGFIQHEETPNIWHKDGVAITEEQIKHVGFIKALRQHDSARFEHQNAAGRPGEDGSYLPQI